MDLLNKGNMECYMMRKIYYIPKEEYVPNGIRRINNNPFEIPFEIKETEVKLNRRLNSIKSRSFENIKDLNEFLIGEEFKIGNFFWLRNVCNCKVYNSKKFLSYSLAKEVLKYDVNIVNTLRKLIDYEKAMTILFEPYQLKLFNLIHNRKLDYGKSVEDVFNTNFIRSSRCHSAEEIYKSLRKAERRKSQLDKMILKLIYGL